MLHSFRHILKGVPHPKKLGTCILDWHQNTLATIVLNPLKKSPYLPIILHLECRDVLKDLVKCLSTCIHCTPCISDIQGDWLVGDEMKLV